MKKFLKVILIVSVVISLAAYFVYNIYRSVYPNYSYESAIEYTYNDRIYKESFIIRDEELIYSDAPGIRSYTVSNGTRVSNGSPILNVYDSEAEAAYAAQIEELDKEISTLESIETSSSLTGELETAKRSLKEQLKDLSSNTEMKNFSNLQEIKNDILYSLNKKQVIVGDESDFSERIQSLKEQKEELISWQKTSPITIASPGTGYFIANIDGRESFISMNEALTLTPDSFEKLVSKKPQGVESDVIGKLVKKYHWYITFELTKEDAEKVKERKNLKINIPSASLSDITVSLEAVNYNQKKDKAVAVLKCGYMSTSLSTLRTAEIEINLADYEGVRISSEAIHFNDNDEKGVYVLAGSQLKFKKVDTVYAGKDYIISAKTDDNAYVKRYDQVVVSGKELYDGKLVR